MLSNTEAKRIHLARAFITNPHVLVTHRPFDEIDDADVNKYLDTLREFVDHRGLEMGEIVMQNFRPRTCFFSGGSTGQRTSRNIAIADMVWHLDDRGLRCEAGGWAGGLAQGRSRVVNFIGNFVPRTSSLAAAYVSPRGLSPEPSPRMDSRGTSDLDEDIALLHEHRDGDKVREACMKNCVGFR